MGEIEFPKNDNEIFLQIIFGFFSVNDLAKELGMFVLIPGLTWTGALPSTLVSDLRQNP